MRDDRLIFHIINLTDVIINTINFIENQHNLTYPFSSPRVVSESRNYSVHFGRSNVRHDVGRIVSASWDRLLEKSDDVDVQ